MSKPTSSDPRDRRGFLSRLAGDVRGNALMIMAAALIPLAGMVGGGIDVSRMYILKTRLQHACDAGSLAGRKTMGGGTWAYNNNAANAQALKFFDANFESGSFGSYDLARSFSESAGKVTGTASATIPMTLMRIFGHNTEDIAVTCDAEMRLPNTDVMFVLDTTGSMAQIPAGDTVSKIASLKTSVKCFYEIVARLDTDATCTTGTPSGGTGNQVQIRFGFVPYATNVNVGKLLPTAWFADTWDYQTRTATYSTQNTYVFPSPATGGGSVTATTDGPVTAGAYAPDSSKDRTAAWFIVYYCPNSYTPAASTATAGTESAPFNMQSSQSGSTQTVTWQTTTTMTYNEWSLIGLTGSTCKYQKRTVTFTRTKTYSRGDNGTLTPTQVFSGWRYDKLPVTVGLLKNGTNWNSSFQWPTGSNGTNETIYWDGCVEERATVTQASYWPLPSGAKDLDIDTAPVPGDVSTQWKPVLPGLIHTRAGSTWNSTTGWTQSQTTTTGDTDYPNAMYYACPTEAKKLQTWPMASSFDSYVDSLTPEGNTYHDIGLIWGARLMSPTGLFRSENEFTPQGGEIERHMIFMTDGDACTGTTNYTAYGVNWFDRRTTDPSTAPTDGCTTTGTLTAQVNARTTAICNAIKNKNITLWVITFGYVDPNTVTRMTNCATSGRYFSANNAAELQATFKSIADQISQLRLTR